jgi:multidrug efflux pump subunit AcrA (membrane-fusion protein)
MVALSAAFAAGCGGQAAPPEAEKTPPAPVKWESARLLSLAEWTELLGTTQPLPEHVARITAAVEGRVLSVLKTADGKPLSEGQHVDAGTVIVHLDDRIVRANRDRAVAAQKALHEELAQAKTAREVATLDVDRLRGLERSSGRLSRSDSGMPPLVSPVDIKKAQLTLEDAEAKLRATQARIEAGIQDIAALDQQLKLYSLSTPRKGRLGRIQVVPGQTMTVGAVAAEVVDLEDEIDVLCYVPPGTARKLHADQSARLGGLDMPSPVAADPEGKVVFIAEQAEPETGGFAVKVRFPNPDAHLRANVALPVRVLTQPDKECLAIPESALMEDQEPPYVLVVEDPKTQKNAEQKEEQVGKARQLQAVVGIRDRVLHQVELVRLEDKDKKWKGTVQDALFIVEKGQGLQTGDPVKLQEEED